METALVPSDSGGCQRTSTAINSHHFKSYPFSPFSHLTYVYKLGYIFINKIIKTLIRSSINQSTSISTIFFSNIAMKPNYDTHFINNSSNTMKEHKPPISKVNNIRTVSIRIISTINFSKNNSKGLGSKRSARREKRRRRTSVETLNLQGGIRLFEGIENSDYEGSFPHSLHETPIDKCTNACREILRSHIHEKLRELTGEPVTRKHFPVAAIAEEERGTI